MAMLHARGRHSCIDCRIRNNTGCLALRVAGAGVGVAELADRRLSARRGTFPPAPRPSVWRALYMKSCTWGHGRSRVWRQQKQTSRPLQGRPLAEATSRTF